MNNAKDIHNMRVQVLDNTLLALELEDAVAQVIRPVASFQINDIMELEDEWFTFEWEGSRYSLNVYRFDTLEVLDDETPMTHLATIYEDYNDEEGWVDTDTNDYVRISVGFYTFQTLQQYYDQFPAEEAYERWEATYSPSEVLERDDIVGYPPHKIWTLVEGDEGLHVMSGYHFVNSIGYFLTEKPLLVGCELTIPYFIWSEHSDIEP